MHVTVGGLHLTMMEKKMSHSKMDDLFYSGLKMQPYLKENLFSLIQARKVFSFRTRMAKFGENFGGQNGHIPCPMCFLHLDNQPMAFQCPEIKKTIKVCGKYEDIFDNDIPLDVVETISEIMKLRTEREEERSLQ